jgi:predicted DNA-binding transcriptional regulator AlpA
MARQKRHASRIYQVIGEPGPGALVAGYVRYSSDMQDVATIATQKRRIQELADRKGWRIVRWYEEPEESAKYEDIERRPIFAQLLRDAGAAFTVVLCYHNNRWARNPAVAYVSLSQLRRKPVWWATADGLWDIDKVQQDGFDVAFAVDTQMNASFVRQLSKRTIDGKVPFGYLPPEYPKAPDGAPSTWRPPRMPMRPDPVTFPALVRIGELAAQGWGDSAIADALAGHVSQTPRFGTRPLTKDTVAAIRRLWLPREFAPGCGHGTIEAPSGEQIEGRHVAAWPYALLQRMVEAKAGNFRRPQREARRRAHEFSRIIVCAGCRRLLRVQPHTEVVYYRDMSAQRKLPCPAHGCLSVNSARVVEQFEEVLASVTLPATWQAAIAERCAQVRPEEGSEQILARRAELEAEQQRAVTAFTKGYLPEADLDRQMERIRGELATLPLPAVRDPEAFTQAAIAAGETLADMAGYWAEALPEERRDIVWSVLHLNGLIYDLERQAIVGLQPRADVLPVLGLGLEHRWELREGGLCLREEYWPAKRRRPDPHRPPLPEPKLSLEHRQQAQALMRAGGSLRTVAQQFGVSRGAIWRLMHAGDNTTDHEVTSGEGGEA